MRKRIVRRKKNATVSRVSPRNSRRACLCPDGTYSRKCCDGTLEAQGIGNITGHVHSTPYQGYHIEHCDDGHHHNAHYHGELSVGATYYMVLGNNHRGCYTILEERGSEGIHIVSAELYSDCETCISAN